MEEQHRIIDLSPQRILEAKEMQNRIGNAISSVPSRAAALANAVLTGQKSVTVDEGGGRIITINLELGTPKEDHEFEITGVDLRLNDNGFEGVIFASTNPTSVNFGALYRDKASGHNRVNQVPDRVEAFFERLSPPAPASLQIPPTQ